MPSNYLILCCPLLLPPSIFPAARSFPMSQFFTSGGRSIGASASVLPMNIQDWIPLGWTGCISLQSKGLSRVFPTPQFESISLWNGWIRFDFQVNMIFLCNPWLFSSVQSLSCVQLFATPWTAARQASLSSPIPRASSNSCPFCQWCHSIISSSVVPSPPTFNLSQHQGLFQWVSSSHQVA